MRTSTLLAKSRLLVPQEVVNSLGDALTLQKILLGTDKRVIPRQLLQSLRDPFFGILIITPLLQSVGISSCSQIFVNKGVRMVAASSGSALNSSALRLSWPEAFPFFRELMAWMISLLVGTSVLYNHVGCMAFTCYDHGDLKYCSLLIACSCLLCLWCKFLYVLPFICSCSAFHLFVRCPIHLLMSFFKPLGFLVHNFLL